MSILKISACISGILILLMFACTRVEAPGNMLLASAAYTDSIDAILTEINAVEKAQQLDTLFENKARLTGFNGCVLVAQQGQIIYKNAFGFSDIKKRDSLKINSAFQLASVSKTFTAAAILLLKDQNKLKLDDDVKKHLSSFPYEGITIKMLLTHRSGLSNYIYFGEPYCDDNNCYDGKTFDNDAVLEIMKKDKPALYATPDKKFEYCNTNYALLASIVEKVSGLNFADFMGQHIFTPLGMKDSWVHDPKKDELHKNRTKGHNGMGKQEEEQYADNVLGDKGIFSTIEDMLKWDQAFYSEKLLKKETISEAFTGYSNEHKGKRNYGYGWRLIDDGKIPKIVYHNGWWHGYNSLFFRRPADQTTIIILSNKYNRGAYQIQNVLSIVNSNSTDAGIEEDE